MSDPYVIIVGGGILTVPAIKRAKEMGFKTIVFDRDDGAPGMRAADVPFTVSTKDVATCAEMAKSLRGDTDPVVPKFDIRGVFTCGADVEVTVAAIAEALHLPGIPVEVATLCNDKYLMRGELMGAEVPSPRWGTGMSNEPYKYDSEPRFPVVVKPLRACGSRGVSLAKDYAEYEKARDWALQFDKSTMVEEYVPGTTHTVELFFDNHGSPHLVSIIDTIHERPPYFVELCHYNPSVRPPEEQTMMYQLAVKAADALGVNWGPFKADIIWSDRGPLIMEVTARLSGGFHSTHTTPLASGRDNITPVIQLATRQDVDVSCFESKWQRQASCQAHLLVPGRRIVSVDGIEEAKTIADEVFVLCKEGDMTPKAYRSSADRQVFFITSAETDDEDGCYRKYVEAARKMYFELEEV